MEMQKNKHKKLLIGIIVSCFTLLAIYLGLAIYFMNHFYFGSTVNCINVSGKTVHEVDEEMPNEITNYTLKLKERGNNEEQVKGNEINLKYNPDGKVQELKDKQNPFNWLMSLLGTNDSTITNVVTYDDELLKKSIDNLSCFNSNNVNEPQNPSFEYTDDGYKITDEVYGNKIDKMALHDSIVNAILNGKTTLDLDSEDCYEKPQYTSKSQEVINTKDTLNKYVSSKITYNFGDKTEVIDGSIINKWINVNNSLEITLDEPKIKEYLNSILNNYNTVGKTRNFVTSLGATVQVSGGDYGWLINNNDEEKELISSIKEGQSVRKEPKYTQSAMSPGSNDIGNTYVEVNMSKQHVWFYKNGSLIVEGDVVTGNVGNNTSTPTGVYSLKYKQRDATLKGQGYSSPVNFWMPFNGGIGIHDASWRSVFGGRIYLTNGSHGCVNSPYYLANTIFNNINEGTPVVCYY
ncbi:L,D-transpeptidase family protein [Clostridium beijerinckii]|uniref:L,D-transpeptidase family protein n=1 Tax=Clostridium beijerinckii TaxID=1520 RepID=UPI001494E623|nr:L,D-transpeptidase/peptidoglycan binding protein [Clostridium beijerinckii]MDG5853365.1 L,D-transpeptidase/peptidoglycan binding protein [Clostridium beijerinckii]